jgi:reactive intermediate/imine deaminase
LTAAGLLAVSTLAHAAGDPKGVEFLNKEKPTAESYPISEAVKVGKLIYLSGRLGTEPGTPKLAEGGIKAEAKQAMENIKSWLEGHSYSTANLVKCTIFLADSKELKDFNEVYKTYFPNLHFPARSAVGVSGLALNARVEVECIAAVDK